MPTIEEIKKLVNDYFGDVSRSPQETREGLEDLSSHIEIMADSLPRE